MTGPYYTDEQVTLYHGDCREILPTLESGSYGAVITDPPFSDRTHENTRSNSNGARRHGNRVLSGTLGFDSITVEDLQEVLGLCGALSRGWVVASLDFRHAAAFYDDPPPGLRQVRVGVWIKTNPNPQISGDRPAQGWEAISYLHRVDVRPSWHGGGRAGNFVLPSAQRQGHPTTKPLPMVAQLVRWFTDPEEIVLDPFAGSGTTLRAAKDEGRRAIGVEIDERYCEVIARRLAQDCLPLGDVS